MSLLEFESVIVNAHVGNSRDATSSQQGQAPGAGEAQGQAAAPAAAFDVAAFPEMPQASAGVA
jgi:hypothetical protein